VGLSSVVSELSCRPQFLAWQCIPLHLYGIVYVSFVSTRLLHLILLFLVRYTLLWNRLAGGCLVAKEIELSLARVCVLPGMFGIADYSC
jgi:hypothetical protein